ncbi:MAG TPA: hypothetical protein VFN82_04675 [Solirubrobacterales bacterium]|nr:hypothetical protein [Solirubrobacterales bacterium]
MIWDSYVVLAGSLVGDELESSQRSAVSRAYYGVFNLARRRLEGHGIPIDNRRAHDRVWRTFKAAEGATPDTTAEWRMIGELGAALRRLRNQSDYADVVPDLGRESVKAVAAAERIVALLEEIKFAA